MNYYNVINDSVTLAHLMVEDAMYEAYQNVWVKIVKPLMEAYWKNEQKLASMGRRDCEGFKKVTAKLGQLKEMYNGAGYDFEVTITGLRVFEVKSEFGCLRCFEDDWNTPQF